MVAVGTLVDTSAIIAVGVDLLKVSVPETISIPTVRADSSPRPPAKPIQTPHRALLFWSGGCTAFGHLDVGLEVL